MKRACLVLSLVLSCATPSMAEVVAKARAWTWDVSVESSGEPWNKDCSLKLVADTNQLKHETSIKQGEDDCLLYGPVSVIVSARLAGEEAHVFVEAARGGDGSHSGPIIEAFRLTKQGFTKLGEQELFDASYRRSGDLVTAITGRILFSLCDVCDGPEVADPADKIFVPVRLTLGCDGICVKPTLAQAERQSMLARFQKRKAKLIEENPRREYEQYVAGLEKELRALLAQ